MAAPEAEAEPLWEGSAASSRLLRRAESAGAWREGRVCLGPRAAGIGSCRSQLEETRRLISSCGEAIAHPSRLGGEAAGWLLLCGGEHLWNRCEEQE